MKKYLGLHKISLSYCNFHDVGSERTAVLIGDSHANAAYDGLKNVLGARGLNVMLVGQAGCPMLIGVGSEGCRRISELIINSIALDQKIVQVIVSTRGSVYLDGHGYGGGDSKNYYEYISSEDFTKSLLNLTAFFKIKNIPVFYISENPELLFEPSTCVDRPFRSNVIEKCKLRFDSVATRQKNYLNIINSIKGLNVISVLEVFCPNDLCLIFSNTGDLLYPDNNHLSTLGSKYQAIHISSKLLLGIDAKR